MKLKCRCDRQRNEKQLDSFTSWYLLSQIYIFVRFLIIIINLQLKKVPKKFSCIYTVQHL